MQGVWCQGDGDLLPIWGGAAAVVVWITFAKRDQGKNDFDEMNVAS